jgi:hypothetical protein
LVILGVVTTHHRTTEEDEDQEGGGAEEEDDGPMRDAHTTQVIANERRTYNTGNGQ